MPRKQAATMKHPIGRDMSPALIHALNHPLRRQILRSFTKRKPEWSPVQLTKLLHLGLSHLSYHMKVLNDLGVIKKTRTKQVRGSTQHFYASSVADSNLARMILVKTKDDDQGLESLFPGPRT